MNYIESALAESPLFASLSGLELNAVVAFLERKRYGRGEVVFKEGELGQEMYIVLAGRIGSCVTQSDGTRRKLYEFGLGRFFGEMAIIEGAPRSATCWAEEDSELLVLQGIDFYRLVFEHPMIALKLLTSIGSVMTSWLNESSRFLNDLVRWGETARRRAVTDELTGLYNRRFLEESLENRFAIRTSGRRMALAMLDLDRIHEVNERFGQKAGDAVIAAVGASFRGALRDGDIAARLAGDEFAFLLPDATLDEAVSVSERLRVGVVSLKLSFPDPKSGKQDFVIVRASLGVAAVPDHAVTPAALMEAADVALRAAKDAGRDRVVCASL
jgi:diguanylate cyclase (GGDEF)-like protein